MKPLTLLLPLLIYSGCGISQNYFPEKQEVLTPDFARYDNFFPIATLDLSDQGVHDKIHVIYVSFDPSIDHKAPFPGDDDIDMFTFSIQSDGLYRPTFDTSALVVGDTFREFFIEGQDTYAKAKLGRERKAYMVLSPEEPEWWQDERIPKNEAGENFRFICHIDMDELVDDDCRMFVFYDAASKQVKCVYQRT